MHVKKATVFIINKQTNNCIFVIQQTGHIVEQNRLKMNKK